MTPSYKPKRLNLMLAAEIDAMLREIGMKTGLKLVTIISQGIRHEYREWKLAGWKMVDTNTAPDNKKGNKYA